MSWTFPLSVALGFALVWGKAHALPPLDAWRSVLMLGSLALFVGSFLAVQWWLRRGRLQTWLAQFAGEYELVLTPDGVSFSGNGRTGFYAWPHVMALEETEQYWLLYVRRDVALPVSKAGLSEQASADFAAEVRRCWCDHPENRGRELPAQPLPFPISARLRRLLGANLLAGLRLACWRAVSPGDFRAGTAQLIALVVLEFFCYLPYAYVSSLPSPVFNVYGLMEFGAEFLMFLLAGVVLGTMMVNRSSIPRLWVMLLAGLLVVEIPYLAISAGMAHTGIHLPSWAGWAYSLFFIGWMLLVVYRTVRLLYVQPAPSAWFLVSVYAFLNFGLTGYFPQQQLFYRDYSSEEVAEKKPRINVEETFYRQPLMVSQALSGLEAQRPGVADLYFVGFAGQAEEKVFSNDVRFARKLLESRFDTKGRSLALINNPDSVANTPLANVHNLDTLLQGVASRMDVNEDVLFLFLASHGARNHTLSVSFWPMDFNDLKAEQLKEMLDRSGIRHRVIVVSACFSGGFLDVLKNDDTLILTASSRDHESYGCGDATEYTYFSEAYFVNALARQDSFVDAFSQARGLIEAREKSEGKDPSRPQIYIGKNIREKLEQLKAARQAKWS